MIILLAPLIAVAVIGAAALLLRAQRGGQRRLVGSVVEPARLSGRMPSILYFTGENCAICHSAQRPALRALAAGLDDGVDIREVDIAVEPALARQYRVMSLPTIIVLDRAGQITDINVGFTSGEALRRQLVGAGMPVAAGALG
jgi:thiol-disulfide isomerase/thioredoxin